MLKWLISDGVIQELRKDGCNFIYPWGVEAADTLGFFSLERGVGYRHTREFEEFQVHETSSRSRFIVRMPEGRWDLALRDEIENAQSLLRRAVLTTLEHTVLMDFVVRFRFRKEWFPSAEIGVLRLRHRASDIYHQYPVREARLNGHAFSVRVAVEDSFCSRAMQPSLYIRDHADEWVVHARMIPKEFHKEVIKICSGWARTLPLPAWASRALLALPGVRPRLWYRNERNPYPRLIRRLLNLNAFPMAWLPAGESIHWAVRMEIE